MRHFFRIHEIRISCAIQCIASNICLFCLNHAAQVTKLQMIKTIRGMNEALYHREETSKNSDNCDFLKVSYIGKAL